MDTFVPLFPTYALHFMRLRAIGFTIAASSLTLVAAMPLCSAASRFWKPEVTRAATVTVSLLKSKPLHPFRLTRRNRSLNRPQQDKHLLPVAPQQQKYQFKQLELELARLDRNRGFDRVVFNQKAENYEIATQRFKALLYSSRIANYGKAPDPEN